MILYVMIFFRHSFCKNNNKKRKSKGKATNSFNSFSLYQIFRTLAPPKVLSLENEKKSKLSFCILLVYSYLCNHIINKVKRITK